MAYLFRDGLPQFRQTGGGSVVRPAVAQCFNPSFDHIWWRVEVGLADFQVNDFLALSFQGASLVQDFEGSFGSEARHALGQLEFVLRGFGHRVETRHYTPL